MRKYTLGLFFFQLLTSAMVMIAEANALSFDLKKTSNESTEELVPEMEANQETDVFPDLITFTMYSYQ